MPPALGRRLGLVEWDNYVLLRAGGHGCLRRDALSRLRPVVTVLVQGVEQDTAVTSAMPRTVNGTGYTGPSEFCATSI